jgi:hypothetical protein
VEIPALARLLPQLEVLPHGLGEVLPMRLFAQARRALARKASRAGPSPRKLAFGGVKIHETLRRVALRGAEFHGAGLIAAALVHDLRGRIPSGLVESHVPARTGCCFR